MKKARLLAAIFAGFSVFLATFFIFFNGFSFSNFKKSELEATQSGSFFDEIKKTDITDDFEGAKVEQDDLERGCPRKDCIPSIDNPQFESVADADDWLNDDERIFGLDYLGVQRAYPQRILNWHEIVNDEVAGEPIAMTFCPLCGTAVSFRRKVDGQTAEFGVSGFLHNNDLVMYDRIEGNLWQQITAEAIVGPAARRDEKLELINTITTTWENWKEEYPDSQVLEKPQGFTRDYDRYPYGTYEEDGEIYYGLENSDQRLHPKKVVYGIVVNDQPKAYPLEKIQEENTFDDLVGGEEVIIQYQDSGDVTFVNKDTGEFYIPQRSFWFAWAAFHPGTDLY